MLDLMIYQSSMLFVAIRGNCVISSTPNLSTHEYCRFWFQLRKVADLSSSLSPTLSLAMTTAFESKLEEKPDLDELIQHVRVGSNWYSLGVLLKLDKIRLDDIRKMNEDSDFKASQMFELWLRTNPNATRRQVIDALKKEPVKEMTVADDYEKILQSEPSGKGRLFF